MPGERRKLADALGCALAEDVTAPIDVPPFDPATSLKPGQTYHNTQSEDMIPTRHKIEQLAKEIIQ